MDDGSLFSIAGLLAVFAFGATCGLAARLIARSLKGGEL